MKKKALRVTELVVELPQGTKKIEWDKKSPAFKDVKEKLLSCGFAKDWCVEVFKNNEFVIPDDNTRFRNKMRLVLRASPISDGRLKEGTVAEASGPAAGDQSATGTLLVTVS